MKRILFLADINSEHTQKWAESLANIGFTIGVFSFCKPESNIWKENNISVFYAKIGTKIFSSSSLSKMSYIKVAKQVKEVINEFQPDIIHAHYASSYGFLGRQSSFKPFIISAWGSDILDFPNKSFIHKNILKKNLRSADVVTATSQLMVDEIYKITSIHAHHIPFGIEPSQFYPKKVIPLFNSEDLVFGSIKSFEKIYGHYFLIHAFAKLTAAFPELPLKLLLVGDGSLMDNYKLLTSKLGIKDQVLFTGKIPYSEICNYHNMIDIFVNPSLNESFGVSVLEASACEKPVIASNIGGLPEVVEDGVTGILVPPKSIEFLYQAMKNLLLNKQEAINMGKKGRQWVQQNFDFKKNVSSMIEIYKKLC